MNKDQPTIHSLYVNNIPEHPLTRLEFIDAAVPVLEKGSFAVRVSSTNELIGTIPTNADIQNVRLQDVERSHKKQKSHHEREDERTLRLLKTLSPAMASREAYKQSPFTHGTRSIEELSLIGADKFETVMQCFNHWFESLTPKERIIREANAIDYDALSECELKGFEQAMLTLWKTTHSALLVRMRSTRPPC